MKIPCSSTRGAGFWRLVLGFLWLATWGCGAAAKAETDAGSTGYRVSGVVRLVDGGPVPGLTQLMIGRFTNSNPQRIPVSPDGRFDASNVPPGTVRIGLHLPGHRLSRRNASYVTLSPHFLIGRVDSNKTNLLVLMERGDIALPEYSPEPPDERPENLPLGGAETRRIIPNAIRFSGQVVDADTQAPLAQFTVTPGLQRSPSLRSWIEWYRTRKVEGTNGAFDLEISLKTGAIVIMAEAEGYLPGVSEPLEAARTKTKIQLQKGVGPRGVLLLPDGRPADGVTVVYLVTGEHAALDNQGTIKVYRDLDRSRDITDPEGEFRFAPKYGAGEVFAANSKGFGRCRTSDLAQNGKFTLQPWARVNGRLVEKGKPVANEAVELGWPLGSRGLNQPWLGLPTVRSDAEGWFSFPCVPSGKLEISTRGPTQKGDLPGDLQPQRQFTVKPGEELELGDVEKTSPAANKSRR